MRPAVAVGLVVLGLQLVTIRGVLGGGQDEEIVFVTTASLVHHGDLSFDQRELAVIDAHTTIWTDAVVRAADGRWFAVYGPGQAILAVPLYLLGRLAAGGDDDGPGRATVVRWICGFNPLVTALTAALITGWGISLGYPRGAAVAAGLLFALATTAWPYAKTFLSEPLSALCYLLAAIGVWRGCGGSWPAALGAGAALACGVMVRPHNIVLAPVILAPLAWPVRRRAGYLAAALAPPLLVAAWWLWFNSVRFGSALDFGYVPEIQGDFSLANLPRGVVGQLFSPGRGLLWYAPPALLALWGVAELKRRDPATAMMLAAAVIAQLLFYSLRSTWWGNWCWGPRYLVPVLPLAMVLALPALPRYRAATAALGLLGLVNALAGLVVYNGLYQDAVYRLTNGLHKLLWELPYSPLIGHWRYAARGYVDLLLWQTAKVDPLFALTALTLRGLPAMLGLWLLRASGREADQQEQR